MEWQHVCLVKDLVHFLVATGAHLHQPFWLKLNLVSVIALFYFNLFILGVDVGIFGLAHESALVPRVLMLIAGRCLDDHDSVVPDAPDCFRALHTLVFDRL